MKSKIIPTLYQWPGATGTESIYPRCVVFHRIFNLIDMEFSVKNVGLPMMEMDETIKIRKMLKQLPILEVGSTYLKSSTEILEHLTDSFYLDSKRTKLLEKYTQAYDYVLYEWSNQIFVLSLLYARWIRDVNYKKFINSVEWGNIEPKYLNESKSELRKYVINYLKKFEIGSLDEDKYLSLLRKQLDALEAIFTKNMFAIPELNHLTIADLGLFMVIQGLLAKTMQEREIIIKDYPATYNWAVSIDNLTTVYLGKDGTIEKTV